MKYPVKNAPASEENKKNTGTNFPQAILSVSRQELDGVELTIKRGMTEEETSLPNDLQGHLFLIAPGGTLESPEIEGEKPVVAPSANGWTPLFNGDGLVYRFDFNSGQAKLTNRLLKTPCYYADLATHQQPKFHNLRFKNLGFGRVSFDDHGVLLGFRNQLNTAFVPFKFANDEQRLLVTWDTGRPFEIDPQTLQLIAPIGRNDQWRSLIKIPGAKPMFQQVETSAHPSFDPNNGGELYTVNVRKSISTILWLSRSVFPRLQSILEYLKTLDNSFLFRILAKLFSLGVWMFKIVESLLDWLFRDDSVDLWRWKGREVGDIEKWKLVLENGRSVKIRQTLHQMGITQDYIVLADTSFKFDLEEIFPYSAIPTIKDSEVLGLDFLDFPELPYTDIYIVRRGDLNNNNQPVMVKSVRIPLAMAHYLVDYENPDGKITLHSEHMCATDPSETIRSTNHSVFKEPEITLDLQQLAGSVCGPMDVSQLGCHVIDVEKAKVESSQYTQDRNYTWSTAFYAYRDRSPVARFEDIYWNSWGCWTDILSKHVYNLYQDYGQQYPSGDPRARQVSLEEVLKITRQGIPASICRLHVDRQNKEPKIELQDRYLFPHNYLGTSAQFIPKANTEGTTAGYIACTIIHSNCLFSEPKEDGQWSNNSEIWILDAANLSAGPLYRLSHPQLNLGFTLHTTWLASLGDDSTVRSYDVRQDYASIIASRSPELRQQIEELFEQEIYPYFE